MQEVDLKMHVSEITEHTLNDSITRFGELIEANTSRIYKGKLKTLREIFICRIENTKSGCSTDIDNAHLTELKKQIGPIKSNELLLYKSSTLEKPKPIIIKKNGKIYAISPLQKIGK